MSERRWDAELDELLAADAETWRLSRVLQASSLRPAPLDPRFKQDLRRRLMDQAYDRLGEKPSIISRLFGAPGLAMAATAVGAFALVAAFYFLHAGPTTSQHNVYIDNTRPVAVDRAVTVKFSQPVPESQRQSVQQGIQIQPATQVTYTWTGNNLVITPVDGSFAGDTQYHVIVPAAATGTARQTDLTFRTQPAPSPVPTATPVPATPSLAIISNRSLGGAKLLVGWTSQHQLAYVTGGGDLDLVAADGSGTRTLAGGVSAAALSPDGTQVLFLAAPGKVEQVAAAGGTPQTLASPESVLAVYWLGPKPAYTTESGLFTVDSSKPLGPPGIPSPDGSKLLLLRQSSTSEVDIAGGAEHAWPAAADRVAWSADSSRVAFSSSAGVFVAAPDGTGAKQVLTVSGEPHWADAQTLFVDSNGGTFLVAADGSNRTELASGPVGSGAVFDDSKTVAVIADGNAQVLKIGATTGLDLQAGNAVVKAFEDARVSGDAATAGKQLDASAARSAPPLVTAGQPHLSRWFPISAQAVPNNPAYLRYVVRLMYSKDGGQEVRWQDETLMLVAGPGGGLVIDAVGDSPTMSLVGPQVIGVQVFVDRIVVAFDSDLDPATIAGAFHIFTAEGKEVPVKASYAARTVTLTVSLAAGRHYTLAIDPTLRDVSGGSPAQVYRQDLFGPPASSPSP